MYRILIAAIVSLVFSVPIQSWALDRELFQSLTGDELTRVQEENEYYIRKYAYNAKRYRLVKVNTGVLLDGENIEVTLFENDKFLVGYTSIDIDNQTGAVHWQGMVIHPTLRAESLLDTYGSLEAARTVYNALMSVELFCFLNEIDQASGFNLEMQVDPMETLREQDINRFESLSRDSHYFYGVKTNFTPRVLPGTYSLQLLGKGGAYHILLERDESKNYMRDDQGQIDLSDPATAQLWSGYQEHKIELGPDPREQLLEERLRSAGSTHISVDR